MGDHFITDDSENLLLAGHSNWCNVEYRPKCANVLSSLHHLGNILGYALVVGEYGKEMLWLQTLRGWENRSRQKSTLEEWKHKSNVHNE